MKRALLILILVIALGIAFLLTGTSPKPPWRPNTQFTFLGFTNAIANAPATNALLGIRHIPRENTSWRTIEISHREGRKWKAWSPLPSSGFAWFYPKPANFDLGATVPTETTSGPFRIVIELQRDPTGKVEQIWQSLRIWLSHFTRGTTDRIWKTRQQTFYITNEFNATGEMGAANTLSN